MTPYPTIWLFIWAKVITIIMAINQKCFHNQYSVNDGKTWENLRKQNEDAFVKSHNEPISMFIRRNEDDFHVGKQMWDIAKSVPVCSFDSNHNSHSVTSSWAA